jgi:hypothetical protein
MGEGQSERARRLDVLFASYRSDIVAYCGWRHRLCQRCAGRGGRGVPHGVAPLDELPERDAAQVWLGATPAPVAPRTCDR